MWAGEGLEGIYSVIAVDVLFNSIFSIFQLLANGSYKLGWLCILINIPKELFKFHLGLITVCKYADSPLLMLTSGLKQEGRGRQ